MTKTVYLEIVPRAPFDFAGTARSHGWCVLPPNRWDPGASTLHRVQRLSSGAVVLLRIVGKGSVESPRIAIHVDHAGDLSPHERYEVAHVAAHMLRLEEDLSAFYALCEERGPPWLDFPRGLGRLLRSPTLFEDALKTICTTNIQWRGTMRMVSGLVSALGAPFPDDPTWRAFPTPEAVAAAPEATLSESIRLGYRSPYVHGLAKRMASGEFDLESLKDSDLPTSELKRELLSIKGVGAYAAATLLMLLGRYDEIAVDTEFRQFVSSKYFSGQRVPDAEAVAVYDCWGRWKYLAYWYDRWRSPLVARKTPSSPPSA